MKGLRNMKKQKLSVISIFLCVIIISSLLLTSCHYKYNGNHEDLYTVAVNNILGISGYESNGEISYNPDITIIETDDYGRILFYYDECYQMDDENPEFGKAFVIMQKSEDGYVYYYQDLCYMPCFDTEEDYQKVLRNLDINLINQFKSDNDWNKEIDVSKCMKAKISHKKPEGELSMDKYDFDEIVYSYAKANGYKGFDNRTCKIAEYCNADAEGKELFYLYCMSADKVSEDKTIYGYYVYAVIVNPDKTFSENSIIEIKDKTQAHQIIKELKEKNSWKYYD